MLKAAPQSERSYFRCELSHRAAHSPSAAAGDARKKNFYKTPQVIFHTETFHGFLGNWDSISIFFLQTNNKSINGENRSVTVGGTFSLRMFCEYRLWYMIDYVVFTSYY